MTKIGQITIFKHIFDTTEPFYVDVETIFKRIKEGNSKVTIEQIRKIKDRDKQNDFKKKLPSICFSGKFGKREAEFLLEHSGLICLDVDKINEQDLKKIKNKLCRNEYVMSCFVSPGGLGLKLVIKIAPDKSNHKSQFQALEKHFNVILGKYTSTQKNIDKSGSKIDINQGDYLKVHIDPSGKDVNRVCFESYDPEIYMDYDSELWYEVLEHIQEEKSVKDQDKIIELLQKWIDKQEVYFVNNRNNYLSKFIYALCRYGVNKYKVKEYLLNKFIGLPERDVDSMIKSCYSKSDVGTESFSEIEKNTRITNVKIQDNKPVTSFWNISDKGKVTIDTEIFLKFINANGFYIYKQNKSDEKWHFIHIVNMIVDIITVVEIKKYVLDYVKENAPKPVYNELQMKSRYFDKGFLNVLTVLQIEQVRDEKDCSYIFFDGFYYKITKDGSNKHKYDELDGRHIWRNQICSKTITEVISYKDHDFNKFIIRAMGKDKEKYESACSSIGYGIHTYKKESLAKLIYACESGVDELDGIAAGGTGKELFFKCLKFVRSVAIVDGKDFDKRDKFKFQTIKDDTQVVSIDDYEGNIKELFTKVTGHFEIEKKGLNKKVIEFNESPKIFLTSNSAPSGFSNSFKRRIHLVEFTDYYNDEKKPSSEFSDRDFFSDNWNQDDWNALYSFIFGCVQYYLKNGLKDVSINNEVIKYKQAVKSTGREFADYFKNVKIKEWTIVNELYEEFKRETGEDIPVKKFYSKMRRTCAVYGWKYEDKGRGIKREMKIIKK